MGRGKVRAGLRGLLLCTAVGAAAVVPTVLGAAAATPSVVHVDCRARGAADGSAAHPLQSMAAASAARIGPGSQVLFARGTRCRGTLTVTASGALSAPVVIGAYGSGRLPRLDGRGADVVVLRNTSNLRIEDLDITSKGTSATSWQNGVHLIAHGTTVRNVLIRRLSVHDIGGSDADEHGAVLIEGYGGTPYGKFDHLTVTENRIWRMAKEGIYMNAAPGDRSRPPAGNPWPRGSTHVVVSKNVIDHTGGDGILLEGTVGTLIERNVLTYGNLAGTALGPNMRCNAGIWSGNQNLSVIQHNVVMHMQTKGCDGDAFDVDVNQDGTVIQYNISVDNTAGMVMMCTSPPVRRAVIRYNLSVNDGASFQDVACVLGPEATVDGIRMYNNTFVAPSPRVAFEGELEEDLYNPGDFDFVNNIVVATRPQTTKFGCGDHCAHNLWFGIPPQGTEAIVANPMFVDPKVTSTDPMVIAQAFRLLPGSPAIAAGIAQPGVTRDFFGEPIDTEVVPTLGFAEPGP